MAPAMREAMNSEIDARIILGGKVIGYRGKYPGLVEEAIIALKNKTPVYLIGGYGGCAKALIDAVMGESPVELTENFQFQNSSYKELANYYNEKAEVTGDEKIDYSLVVTYLNEKGIAGLSNGLTEKENKTLFSSTDILEVIGVMLKGLSKLQAG